MENIKANELDYLPTYFRCKKCLTLQKILEITFPSHNLPFYHIYIVKVCQNKHYEKYIINNLEEINNGIDLSKLNCFSCNLKLSQYYCLLCYKTFCKECKKNHEKSLHNKIIKLKDIDNICFNHPFQENNNKFKKLFGCKLCCNDGYSDYEDEYLTEINEFQKEKINFSKLNFEKEYNQIQCNDNNLYLLSKEYKKKIDKEYEYIQNYYNQIKNILQKKIPLNFILYQNLQLININEFYYSDSLNNLTYDRKKLLFERGHFFYYSRYNSKDAKELQNKLLINNDENHFKMNPQELKFKETLIFTDTNFVGLDAYKNINNIPILLYSLKNKIYLVNLIKREIIKEIIVKNGDKEINFLKYFNYNKLEYIICKIKDDKIIIYDIQNDYNIIFKLESKNIRSCILFNYNSKIYLFVSFLDKVNIYDINNNNNQLITSIQKQSQINNCMEYTDNIFIDKNNILYIIICYRNKIISLKNLNYKMYKEYINKYPDEGILKLPKVYEFENNITYLLTIFYNHILNIYDFYSGDIIKQIDLSWEFRPCDYFFWNFNLLLIIGYDDTVNIIDIFTGEKNYLDDTFDSYFMKKIYLDDCEESIIYVQKYCDIRFLSNKRSSYLINKEKEEYDKKKEECDKENKKTKDKYDSILDDINLGSFFD